MEQYSLLPHVRGGLSGLGWHSAGNRLRASLRLALIFLFVRNTEVAGFLRILGIKFKNMEKSPKAIFQAQPVTILIYLKPKMKKLRLYT
jgi:hypothetical protein